VTPDEIIDDLNSKYFVGLVRDRWGLDTYTRVCWEDCIQDVPGTTVVDSQTFGAFRKRFPVKRMINGKLQNVGNFWLRHPRRRQHTEEFVVIRVSRARR
jgi:hypothetical protein